MKKIITPLIFFLLWIGSVKPQSIEDPFDYFPLHVGDVWTYQLIDYDYFNDDTLSISYRTSVITGDTVLSDRNKYFAFQEGGSHFYYRIDSSNFMVINNGHGEYYLQATPDSIWTDEYGMINYISVDTSVVVGLGIIKPKIIYLEGYGIFNRTLAKGLGLVYSEEGDLGLHLRKYLVYAKINGKEYGTPVGVEKNFPKVTSFKLLQNYPNPFGEVTPSGNSETTIKYSVSNVGIPHMRNKLSLHLVVYDILGRKVATLVNKTQAPGNYSVQFNAKNLPSGVYFYSLRAGKYFETKKMILVR